MPHLSRLTLLLGGLLVAWSAPAQGGPEAACTAERLAYYDAAVGSPDLSPAERRARIDRGADLIARWEDTAPRCTSRLHEARAFLLTGDPRYAEELVRDVRAYLAGDGRAAETRTRIILGHYLALGLDHLGRTREAARAYDEAAGLADRAEARFGVSALLEAASMAHTLGDVATARTYLRDVLRLLADSAAAERIDGSDYSLAAATGQAHALLSDIAEAEAAREAPGPERDALLAEMDRAAARALGALGTKKWDAGIRSLALNRRALALAHRGRFAEARALSRTAMASAREAGDVYRKSGVFQAWMTAGEIHRLAGDAARARAAFDDARAEAVRIRETEREAEALGALGRLAEDGGDWATAGAHYSDAIDRLETFRDRVGLADWSASAFASMLEPYRGLVRARLAEGAVEEAFRTLEQTRARYLRDLRDHLAIRRMLTPEARVRVDSLAALLADVRAEVGTTAAARARTRERVGALQAEIEAATGRRRTAEAPLDLDALQRHLGAERRTLVSYVLDDRGSAAFVVRPDTLLAVPLEATARDIRAALRRLGGPWRDGRAEPAFDLDALHALYRMLVAPFEPHVPTERVVIVPDVDVATVPFAMLTTARAESYTDAPYLLRRWTLSTELAAAFAADAPRLTGAPISVLALGRSAFGRSTWNAPDLAHVARELDAVARLDGAAVFRDAAATEARFAALAPDARVIHLASHALADPALPLYSHVALADGGEHDGTLHLYEILELPLAADLVVLSGCATADGGRYAGEGLIGLQFGMRAAGAGAALATLWPVPDAATADLMAAFYDGLADGLGKDEALRRAQISYLDASGGVYASPFFWAAPVLSGSVAPVPLRRRARWHWLFAGLALAAGLAWAAHRRRARA